MRAAATAERIDSLLAEGRAEEAVAGLPALVDRDPYDERFVEQLMRALVACGRQGEATSSHLEWTSHERHDPKEPRRDPVTAIATTLDRFIPAARAVLASVMA